MIQAKLDIVNLADQVQYVTSRQPCLPNTRLPGLHMSNYIDAQCAHSRIFTQVEDNSNDSCATCTAQKFQCSVDRQHLLQASQ